MNGNYLYFTLEKGKSQYREVGFHNAVKGILYGFLGVSGCRHNVGFGGDNFVGEFGGGLHIATKGGFQAGCKSIHLLQIVVLTHLELFADVF